MNSAMIKDFQNRVVNASKEELLIINYELLLLSIDEAIEAIEIDNEELFNKRMVRSHGFLRELTDGLDFRYDIAKELMSLYIYMNKQFIEASLHIDSKPLEGVKKLLNILLIGWKDANGQQGSSNSLVSNGQKSLRGFNLWKRHFK